MSTINENNSPYYADFVKSVQEGREEYKRDECTSISVEDLWK